MEITEVIQNKNYFTELTFRHLTTCLKAHAGGEFFSASVWASVFIEALLKDILKELDGGTHSEELSLLIRHLTNYAYNGNGSVDDSTKVLFKDIAVRCNEIKSKRNRLVHDTGVERGRIDLDANDVNNNVIQIVKQYIQTGVAKGIYEKNISASVISGTNQSEPTFPVFISTITPHTFEQSEFLNSFCDRLKGIGVNPVKCILTDFDKKDPMGKVRDIISKCNAVIVIGLERSHVYFLKDKEGSEKESENTHRKYTSAWLQIECGIAIALRKRIFVMCQEDIHSDGIFDRYWNSYTPIEIGSSPDINHPNVKLMLQEIKEFVDSHKE